MKSLLTIALAVTTCLLVVPSALAAAPANDARESAEVVTVPKNVSGTTAEATLEPTEPAGCGSNSKNSVWYRIVGTGKRIALGLEAEGDLDAYLDVYNYSRSQPQRVDCTETSSRGLATISFRAKVGVSYFIRVAERSKSVSGAFRLRVLLGSEPAKKPGRRLPGKGARGSVNLASNPSDAWSITMRSGTPYLLQLSTDNENGCATAYLYAPGQNLDSEPDDRVSCNDPFTLFTPGPGAGGRYTIIVESSTRTLLSQRYRLRAGRARSDDIAPGRFWGTSTKRGRLSGDGIDIRDLYNFDLDRRAVVSLRLSANADFYVRLRSVGGRSLACTCNGDEINRKLPPGTYFAEVRAEPGQNGRYTLRRNFRTITRTTTTFNGAHHALAGDKQSVSIGASVTPAGRGRLEIVLERKDPAFGWMFVKRWRGTGAGGGRSATWTPPGVGEYRAKSTFSGSRNVNPSRSGWARLSVRR